MPDWSRRKLRSLGHVSGLYQSEFERHGTCHPVHETNKSPKCYSIVLLNGVDRGKKIAHALDIAKITVIFIVREEHIFHLLKMNVGSDFCER